MSYYLLGFSKTLLFLTALTPLVVGNNYFPFVFDKLIFFRSLVELSFVLLLIYVIYSLYRGDFYSIYKRLKELFKNPLTIFIFLFLASALLSGLLAVNSYRAFWGDIERGEGVFSLIHYVIFFLTAFLVFQQKDWFRFFKISLIVSLILAIFAFLQLPIFGIEKLPFHLIIQNRPGSLVGNSSFLSSYMIFAMIFAIIIYKSQRLLNDFNKFQLISFKFWRYFSILIIIISVLMIFITATRGAILGLVIGIIFLLVYFSFQKQSIFIRFYKFQSFSLKKLSIFFLALIFLFSAVFWFTREAAIWQSIPGLDRLAQTRLSAEGDSSTAIRFSAWKAGWEAFKERPIFGWGSDNYSIAFNKYYNPDLLIYGEGLWIDRAHNKIIDIAVMQGIFGLIAYLGIFVSILYFLFKKQKVSNNFYEFPLISSLVIVYFIHNLFLFDHPSSYLAFFALMGFFVALPENFNGESPSNNKSQPFKYRYILSISIGIIMAMIAYSLYFYNYVPYRQARDFWKSTENTDINLLLAQLKQATNPYNFAQYTIRGKGIDLIYLGQYFENEKYISNPKFSGLGDFLIGTMDDFIEREPYDIRLLMKQVEALNAVAAAYPEKSEALYKKGEAILKKALAFSPKRQEIYYHLAFNLSNQKRFNESVVIARQAVDLSPMVARSHYHLGLMMFLAGDNDGTLKEFEIVQKLDPNFSTLLNGEVNNILLIYNKVIHSFNIDGLSS